MVHYVFQVVTNLLTCCFIPPSDCQVQWSIGAMGVGFETTTGPSGPSRSWETWHVLFSFTNERGKYVTWHQIGYPTCFSKVSFLEPPPKKNGNGPKNSNDGVLGVKKKTRTFFGVAKISPRFLGPALDLGSTRINNKDQVSEGSYKLHPRAFYSKQKTAK